MIGLVRAATLCATLAFGLVTAQAADKAFKRDDLADSAIKLEAQIKSEAGPVAKSGASLRTDADAAFKRSDFRTGLQILGQIAATSPGRQRQLAAAGPHHFPDPRRQLHRTDLPVGTRLDRGLHRLSARRQRRRGGRRAGRARPRPVRAQAVASGAGLRCGCRSICARSPTCAASTRKCATSTASGCLDYTVDSDSASPRACFQFSEDLAKRTDFAPFLALAGSDKPALSSEGQAALRRRPEAWRALQHQSARRAAVHRQGNPAEIGRIQHLCARPQAVRALHRAGLCAAAHRPARHSRWSASTRRR